MSEMEINDMKDRESIKEVKNAKNEKWNLERSHKKEKRG